MSTSTITLVKIDESSNKNEVTMFQKNQESEEYFLFLFHMGKLFNLVQKWINL